MSYPLKQHKLAHCTALILGLSPFTFSIAAPTEQDTLIVNSSMGHSRLTPTEQQEKEKLEKVAGGTNLVMIEKTRVLPHYKMR
ncbi:hypothetical protein [Providencia rustigianii]|uniref:hypothetical protein n=1 Tax=Providencia rustigianii TaxID=158850 RepID=UPI0035E86460